MSDAELESDAQHFDKKVFADVLRFVKADNNLNWRLLASELSARPHVFKIDEETLTNLVHKGKAPWGAVVRAVGSFVERRRTPLPRELRVGLDKMLHAEVDPDDTDGSAREHSFIGALGLNSSICDTSTRFYRGPYLHFALDEDGRVVTSRCLLSSTVGTDGVPIFRSRRRIPSYGFRRYQGAYFANDSNLYLLATPLRSVDIRLSLFSIVSGERQDVLRGVVLGATRRSSVLTSRCALVRADRIGPGVRRTVFASPLLGHEVPSDLAEVNLYLHGTENPPFIKISTGE